MVLDPTSGVPDDLDAILSHRPPVSAARQPARFGAPDTDATTPQGRRSCGSTHATPGTPNAATTTELLDEVALVDARPQLRPVRAVVDEELLARPLHLRRTSGGVVEQGQERLTDPAHAEAQPAPPPTCAAAHLFRHDPARVDGFRRPPTSEWVAELEKLAKQVEKKPGAYVLRRCHECGAVNRIALFPPPQQQAKCGGCKTALAAVE